MIPRKIRASKQSSPKTLIEGSTILNSRKTIFKLVRELVEAQFIRSDQELTTRLWKKIANREIEIDRVINLLYKCTFHDDDLEMTKVDEEYQQKVHLKNEELKYF